MSLMSVLGGIFFFVVGAFAAGTSGEDVSKVFLLTFGAVLAVGWVLIIWIIFFLVSWVVLRFRKKEPQDGA